MTDFSRFLRTRREILALSQRALAERSGVSQPLIAAIESGARQPSADARTRLTEALAVRPSVALRVRRTELLAAVTRRGGTSPQVIGSVARGTDTEGSDLDLVVTFPPGATILDLLALEDEISALLSVPVDVISAGSSGLSQVADRMVPVA